MKLKSGKKKNKEKDLISNANKYKHDFQQYETINESIYTEYKCGAVMDQSNW